MLDSSSSGNQSKKRGRKPKGKILNYNNIVNSESDEDPIITHLPIKLEDLNDINTEIKQSGVFINSEPKKSHVKKGKKIKQCTDINDLTNKDMIRNRILGLEKKLAELELNGVSKTKIHVVDLNKFKNNKDISCWWCKHNFDSCGVCLPEKYYDGKYYVKGHFCSYNCALAYNLDLADDKSWCRTSLLHKMYSETFTSNKVIKPSDCWLILKKFGGKVSIEDYRKQFLIKTKEYTFLEPPFISRMSYIVETLEETNNEAVSVNKVVKMFEKDNLVLKRSKPLKTSIYSLESTMGLKRIKKKK
jgi:hypothetical protein